MLAVSYQTDGRSARSQRFQVADLRTTRNQHSGPREKQPETCARKRKRQKANQKVSLLKIHL